MSDKKPSHVVIPFADAETMMRVIEDIPTRWGITLFDIMQKAKPINIPEDKGLPPGAPNLPQVKADTLPSETSTPQA